MTPNPSRSTMKITRFEWPSCHLWWPTYSYRLGNWEWLLGGNKNYENKNLLVYNNNQTDSFEARNEAGFPNTRDLQISTLTVCAILQRLQKRYGSRLHLGTVAAKGPMYSTVETAIDEIIKDFPRVSR